jgi:hypothetical protein
MTTPGQQQIEVDLLTLQQSKDGIATNISELLQAGISSARGQIYRGVPVGERSESLEVDMSRQAIAYAMKCFWQNGEAYMHRAHQMTQFLATMLDEYKDADDFAKLKVDAVTETLDKIRRAVPAAPQPTPNRGDVP